MAVSHIQNTAPGPPRQMAVEIPAMFPVPTREAVDTISAWKEESPFFIISGLGHHADGFNEKTELYETCSKSEIDSCTQKEDDQDIAVKKVAQSVDKIR